MWVVEAALRGKKSLSENWLYSDAGSNFSPSVTPSLLLCLPVNLSVFLNLLLHFHLFPPLLAAPCRTHNNKKGLSSAPHTYRNTPRWPICIGHELDIEPGTKRERREGRNGGGNRGAQGHQPSVTVESYFFPPAVRCGL